MDKKQIGKIAGTLIASILLILVINEVGDRLVPLHRVTEPVQVEAEEADTTDVTDVAEEEAPAAAEPIVVETIVAEAMAPQGPSPLAALLAAATQKQGQKASKVCRTCHSFDQGGRNKVGPNLWGVVGAQVASVEGFRYSKALSGLGGEWGYEDLFRYLANPREYAPGTKMTQKVKKPEARAAVILFLRALSDAPMALPAVPGAGAPEVPGAAAPEVRVIEVEMPTGSAKDLPVY